MRHYWLTFLLIGALSIMGCHLFSDTEIPPNEIWIFTIANCAPCKDALLYLNNSKVEFKELKIDQSKENLDLFKKYKGKNLPLILIGGKPISGFNDPRFLAAKVFYALKNRDPQSVVLYSQNNCVWCIKVHNFLKNHHIPFQEYFIDTAPKRLVEFNILKGRGTPLVLIGSHKITGFDEPAIREALKQAKLM